MLYREIIAVSSEIHTKHINTLCGQNVELVNVKLAVRTVTTGLYTVNIRCRNLSVWWAEWRCVRFLSQFLGFPCQYHSTIAPFTSLS
jgi:hypothetical protein